MPQRRDAAGVPGEGVSPGTRTRERRDVPVKSFHRRFPPQPCTSRRLALTSLSSPRPSCGVRSRTLSTRGVGEGDFVVGRHFDQLVRVWLHALLHHPSLRRATSVVRHGTLGHHGGCGISEPKLALHPWRGLWQTCSGPAATGRGGQPERPLQASLPDGWAGMRGSRRQGRPALPPKGRRKGRALPLFSVRIFLNPRLRRRPTRSATPPPARGTGCSSRPSRSRPCRCCSSSPTAGASSCSCT
jgi:hypothetical protein